MIKVVNKKNYNGPGEYIGRPSVLGNPFPVSMGRDKCIQAYDSWIHEKMINDNKVKSEVDRLTEIARKGDLVLVCWCKPLACHGDVLKRIIEIRM